MDAFLTREAVLTLEALAAVSSQVQLQGCLLGHKRGRRFIVEKVFPVPGGFEPTPDHLARLDEIFRDRVIGFFATRGAAFKKRLLQPLASGRVFVVVRPRKKDGLDLESFLIDYDGRFAFVPVGLIREKAARP